MSYLRHGQQVLWSPARLHAHTTDSAHPVECMTKVLPIRPDPGRQPEKTLIVVARPIDDVRDRSLTRRRRRKPGRGSSK